MNLSPRRSCRACGGLLTPVLSLGHLALNAFPLSADLAAAQEKVPHDLLVCRGCGLAQLGVTVPPDRMFREYWYKSGINEAMQEELHQVALTGVMALGRELQPGDRILDIGANDGTLLKAYQRISGQETCPWMRAAVEPALNFAQTLQEIADVSIQGYFPTDKLDGMKRGFKLITAVAMCYDLEDPLSFFRKITELLHPSGIAIVQFQDLEQQIRTTAFDNIVAEHLEYYTLDSLAQVCTAAGLYPESCMQTPINGGSLRVVLRRGYVQPRDWAASVQLQRQREDDAGLSLSKIRYGLQAFDAFRDRIASAKTQILATLEGAAAYGLPTAYGASTKGNTLLQVLELGPADLRCVADRSVEKHGRFTITGIPIVSEQEWRDLNSPLALVPIWQFREAMLRREAGYLARGGQFLFPLPHATIVSQSWHRKETL